MSDLNSVHLQYFPSLSNITFNDKLVEEMDLVKEICSAALFLRDKENLRVRLPLNKIRIIGQGMKNLEKYRDVIADEINVKNVFFEEDIGDLAMFILEVDLKKLGAKYGEKLKNIMKDVKENKWKKLDNNKIEIADTILENDEYTIKLKPKNKDSKNIQPLSNNNAIIELDLTVTPELELEGIARDLVRTIQQNRKDANLDISDRIKLSIKTTSPMLIKAINNNEDYIKNQTLAKNLRIVNDISEDFSFGDDFNNEFITIGFSIVK